MDKRPLWSPYLYFNLIVLGELELKWLRDRFKYVAKRYVLNITNSVLLESESPGLITNQRNVIATFRIKGKFLICFLCKLIKIKF